MQLNPKIFHISADQPGNPVYRRKPVLVILICCVWIFGCNERVMETEPPGDLKRLVSTYGTAATFDIATWNVQAFPKENLTTIAYLAQMIRDLDIDMFGLQELNDENSFYALLDSLPGYDGYISALPDDILKLGILYKRDMIAVTTPVQIFTGDWYAFPRPPFVAYVEVREENRTVFDFTLIVLHLKAQGDPESRERRRAAAQSLKAYIDLQILPSADPDLVVLGDFNDEIDDPEAQNVFWNFIEDSLNYRFLTRPLSGEISYIGGFNSLIDHIMITSDVLPEYNAGRTQVLKLDIEFAPYLEFISDHRPVLAQFPVF